MEEKGFNAAVQRGGEEHGRGERRGGRGGEGSAS